MKKIKNKKILILGIVVLLILVLVAGGTYAIWEWESTDAERTRVVLTASSDFSCSADGGGNIDVSDIFLMPTTCTDSEHAIKRKIVVTPTIKTIGLDIDVDVWLNVNDIDTELSQSNNLRYVVTTMENSCTDGVVSYGNFRNKRAGSRVNIMNDTFDSSTDQVYYLYVWLDKAETSVDTAGKEISLSLGGQCADVLEDEVYSDKAYAVYSSDDNSLTFYREETAILENSQYNGKTATAVYTDFEDVYYDGAGSVPWTSYASSIKSVSFVDEIFPKSTGFWFYNFTSCTDIDFTNLNTYRTTSMREMFRNASAIETIDLFGLTAGRVTDMGYMFAGCTNLKTVILGDYFDTDRVKYVHSMFRDCINLISVVFGDNVNFLEVLDMDSMFRNCKKLTTINLSNVYTDKVEKMSYMFYDCATLTSVVFGENFNTSNVTDMTAMFNKCVALASIGFGENFATDNVITMESMFGNCDALTTLDLSGFNTSNVTNMSNMFSSARYLTNINLGEGFVTSSVTNMSGMFYKAFSLTLDCSNWDVSSVTNYTDFNTNAANVTAPTWKV